MNLNQTNNERENVIAQAYWKKIEKLSLQLFILRNKEDILSDKINKKESQLNETRVKYEAIKERQERQERKAVEKMEKEEAMKERQERKAVEKMEKEEAMKERQERKAVEKMEKEEAMKERQERKAVEKMEKEEAMKERQERKAVEKMEKEEAMKERQERQSTKLAEKMAKEEMRQNKKYISTASQLQSVSKLSNETIIHLVNSDDISIENLMRLAACRLQEDYPSGWDIPTFKKQFIQDFGSTNWLKGMQNQSNSISSVFYRMCPESTTSTSKLTRKMHAIPSFVKVTSSYGASPTYIFDANLYLHF